MSADGTMITFRSDLTLSERYVALRRVWRLRLAGGPNANPPTPTDLEWANANPGLLREIVADDVRTIIRASCDPA